MKKLLFVLAMTSSAMSLSAQKRINVSPFEKDSITLSCRTNKTEATISLTSNAKSLIARVVRKHAYATYEYEALLCKVIANKKYIIDDSLVESYWTWFGRYNTQRVVQCYMRNPTSMDCLERNDAEQEKCNCKYPFHPLSSPIVWIAASIVGLLFYVFLRKNRLKP